ncbi:hypothetical protein PMI02_03044 [Novosphingobium sp. AP12]|nr:hypothetical protein PMI02_03044 [Novosphingobium sp. AP12]
MPVILMASVSGQHVAVVYDAAVLSGLERAGYVTVGEGRSAPLLDCRCLVALAEAAICATQGCVVGGVPVRPVRRT